jgi:hypothetical protein
MATPRPATLTLGRDRTIDDLVRDLCSSETLNGRYLVQMPVLTAFGSMVSVSIWPEGGGETFMVTDDGLAYHEITTAVGSERIFSSVAKARCARYGASFDGSSMLFMKVDKQRLKGAVVAMAALIREVIDETLEKSFAAKVDAAHEAFIRRVAEAFPRSKRTEHAHVIGQSTTVYPIDVLVETERKLLAFDYFSKSGNSVNSAYVALSDIARLEEGPVPIGVTPNLRDVGPKLTLISSVAQVIEADAGVETYARLAA